MYIACGIVSLSIYMTTGIISREKVTAMYAAWTAQIGQFVSDRACTRHRYDDIWLEAVRLQRLFCILMVNVLPLKGSCYCIISISLHAMCLQRCMYFDV